VRAVLREEGLPDKIQLQASGPSRHSSSGISFKSVTVEDPINAPLTETRMLLT
jgi:hypothetical protein